MLSLLASPPATGICSGTPFDISLGGTVLSPQATGHNAYMGSCGTGSGSDEVFVYRGTMGQVDITANSGRTIATWMTMS